ncbi:hypothetical protein NHH73_18275 [Oxalobacteraceae bacterium OTU3CINTB1]|nr:hypothetical protein NHH73_18275 [Oxalobacteraceae bacterium OTU3CINTB1]
MRRPKPIEPAATVVTARQAALQSLGFKPTTRGWEKSLSTDGGGDVGGRVTFGFDNTTEAGRAQNRRVTIIVSAV